MRDWFIRIVRRAALAGAVLFAVGFGGTYLLGQSLRAADLEPASIEAPILFGLGLGASGFVLVFVFEALGNAWNKAFGRKPPKSENAA